jgi:hypothetical protein
MIPDQLSKVRKALPAAAATANSDPIDLGAAPGPVPSLQVEVQVEATTTLVDGKDIDLELQHSSDDGDSDAYAAVPGTGNFKVTGITGNGSAAYNQRLYLPKDVKRYIRLSATVETGGGNNTAKYFTLQLLA